MITVAILINGQPIAARSAVNVGPATGGRHRYYVDDGSVILHARDDGAVALAIEMLKTIKPVPHNRPTRLETDCVQPGGHRYDVDDRCQWCDAER